MIWGSEKSFTPTSPRERIIDCTTPEAENWCVRGWFGHFRGPEPEPASDGKISQAMPLPRGSQKPWLAAHSDQHLPPPGPPSSPLCSLGIRLDSSCLGCGRGRRKRRLDRWQATLSARRLHFLCSSSKAGHSSAAASREEPHTPVDMLEMAWTTFGAYDREDPPSPEDYQRSGGAGHSRSGEKCERDWGLGGCGAADRGVAEAT